MREMVTVFPQWRNFRVDQTNPVQSRFIHSIGNIRHSQAFEELEELQVFFLTVHICLYEILAQAQFFRRAVIRSRQLTQS